MDQDNPLFPPAAMNYLTKGPRRCAGEKKDGHHSLDNLPYPAARVRIYVPLEQWQSNNARGNHPYQDITPTDAAFIVMEREGRGTVFHAGPIHRAAFPM